MNTGLQISFAMNGFAATSWSETSSAMTLSEPFHTPSEFGNEIKWADTRRLTTI